MTEKEKMLSGNLYSPVDKELMNDRIKAKNLLHRLNVTEYVFSKNAAFILRELLPNCPSDLYIEPPFYCDFGYNIFCGKRVYFNMNCVVLDVMKITIGDYVLVGPGTHIYTASHPKDALTRRTKGEARTVTIGNDTWIGGNCVICPGVTIGSNCIIGAGSVVTKDIPDNCMAAGNPVRVIKQLK